MTQGIHQNEPDPRILYADIIDLPCHRSENHPHMSMRDRAAQFSPFSALSGFEEMISEETAKNRDEPYAFP